MNQPINRRPRVVQTGQPGSPVPPGTGSASAATTASAPGIAAQDGLGAEGHARKIAETERLLRDKATALVQRLTVLEQALPELAETEAALLEEQSRQARQQAEQKRTARRHEIETSFAEHWTAHRRAVADAIHRLAPAGAAADWADLHAQTVDPAPATHQRWGRLTGLDDPVPAIAPLVDHKGWYLRGDRAAGEAIAVGAVLRLLAQAPVKHVSVSVFDPRIRGSFGRFAPIRGINADTFPPPASDARSYIERVTEALGRASRNAELTVAGGTASLTDLWRTGGVPEGTLSLLVLLDYPYGVTSDLQQHLEQAANTGGATGTTLIVVEDPGPTPGQDVVPERLRSLLLTLESDGHTWTSDGLPPWVRVNPDPLPDETVFAGITERAAAAARSMQGPTIPLTELLAADIAEPWRHSSESSVDALVGRVRNAPLEISLRTENPPHPNAIIGGAVGQGKSNLLLDLIYSLAVRYSPDELRFDLLDFKRGLEFKRFDSGDDGTGWLPHVDILSLESNHEFGVAVLQHFDDEMERRSRLFKEAGASSLDAYRRLTGQTMPRRLLVVDEFHVLFEGDERLVEAAVELTSKIAKQGRAYGLHMLFASQTLSGIQSLAIKGDSIFAQFPIRISLKNTPQESEAILSRGNRAASELTYRGEVIVNTNFGADPEGSNVRGIAAFAEPSAMEDVQRDLWSRSHGEPPLVFVGSGHALWDDEAFAEHRLNARRRPLDDGLDLWLGRPIAVTQRPYVARVEPDADRAIAIVGPGATVAAGALRSLMLSACHDLAGTGSIVMLDGLEQQQPWIDEVAAYAADCDVDFRRVPRSEIASYLRDELAARLDDPAPVDSMLLVGLGLQRVRGMDATDSPGGDDEFGFSLDTPASARTVLARAASDGAMAGVYFAGWWANLRTLEADLGVMRHGVGIYLTADLGTEDLRTIAGPMVGKVGGSPRLGVYDVNSDAGLVVIVPFEAEIAKETRA